MMRRLLARWLARDVTILPPFHRATHTYVVGQSGTGKSRALESWAMQDILAGRGVGVIDPHGDLFRNITTRLVSRPGLWERVVIIDPTGPEWVVGLNPLQVVRGFSQQRLALFLTDIIVKIWGVSPTHAPRMVWLLTNSFLALADLDLTLLDLPRFLLDAPFREALLPRVTHEEVLAYFQLEYPRSEGAVRQWATPVLNKIGGLIFDPDVRLMFASSKPLDFRTLLDTQRVLLVNLSKGQLGEGTSALVGAFIVAQIQKAALSRADTHYRPPYYLYLDEFQNYTTDNITDVLSESRKYTLSLTLAHQYLDQLEATLREAVLNTSGTLISFRVSYRDAYRLAKELFPSPAARLHTHVSLRQRSFRALPILLPVTRQRPLGWDGLAQLLANLPYREFWTRRRGTRLVVHQRTLEVPDPGCPPEDLAALYERSGMRYGSRKRDVERELRSRAPAIFIGHQSGGRSTSADEGDGDTGAPSIWSE